MWTNTAFDAADRHVQYVYVIPDVLVTLVDIHLTKAGVDETRVAVVYERTALSPEANDHVAHLAKGDAKSGPEWAEAINGYLRKPEQPRIPVSPHLAVGNATSGSIRADSGSSVSPMAFSCFVPAGISGSISSQNWSNSSGSKSLPSYDFQAATSRAPVPA